MSVTYLISAASFYVRRGRRLKRAGLDPLNDLVEAAIWAYARRAADRLEHLRDRASQPLEPVPVPVKYRRSELPDAL